VRKWLFTLAVCVGLGLALAAWLGVEDSRRATLLEIQTLHAANRALRAETRQERLARDGAPEEEVREAVQETDEAWAEYAGLNRERARRQQSWHARLVREVKRRTGW
jgi:hypothetical protein